MRSRSRFVARWCRSEHGEKNNCDANSNNNVEGGAQPYKDQATAATAAAVVHACRSVQCAKVQSVESARHALTSSASPQATANHELIPCLFLGVAEQGRGGGQEREWEARCFVGECALQLG